MTDRRYPDRPFVGVGAVVLGAEGVLMIQRGKPPRAGSWSLPGGAQELGETVAEAAAREVREETGLEIEVLGLVDVVDSIRRDATGAPEYHYTLVDVAARAVGGQLAPGGDARDARWFAPEEIAAMAIWSETKRIIDEARERFSAATP
ncbi:MAG: NUDIX hydrolase [Rhodospirillaceae bacterium]